MARRKPQPPAPPIEAREFRSVDEIDFGTTKLERRIAELEALDVRDALQNDTGADDVAISNVRATLREVFGATSPEFAEHQHVRLWAGAMYLDMHPAEVAEATERGRRQVIGILRGLIARLQEKRADLTAQQGPAKSIPSLAQLNLHPRILDVAGDLYADGYPWEAVFAASKALVNYVKERSGRHDLDGAPLMRTVFSRSTPSLAFSDLADQTDLDEQEGMMHLFEGAVLGIRNPGGHSFPEGPEQRALEYLSLLSLLAYRVQEAKRRKP